MIFTDYLQFFNTWDQIFEEFLGRFVDSQVDNPVVESFWKHHDIVVELHLGFKVRKFPFAVTPSDNSEDKLIDSVGIYVRL